MTTPSPSPSGHELLLAKDGRSPAPWSKKHDADGFLFYDATGRQLCLFADTQYEPSVGINGDPELAEWQADVVLHAVNSLPAYQACVEALRSMLEAHESSVRMGLKAPGADEYSANIARTALAKLESVK